MSDSTQILELAPRPQLPTPAVPAVAETVNAPEVQGVEEMQEVQAAAKPAPRQPRPVKRNGNAGASKSDAAKPALRNPVTRINKVAAAEALAKALADTEMKAREFEGLQDVTAKCVHMADFGAFFEVTEGPAKGFSGLLHLNNMPGGKPALEALKLSDILTLDITDAPVKTKRNKPVVKLAFDGFGKQRRAAETRRAVFARGTAG